MKHVMIDIETLGRRNDAIITQIGAVFFDPYNPIGTYGEKFKRDLALNSQKGRTVSTDTLDFWFKQPQEATQHIVNGKTSLKDALQDLRFFILWTGSMNFPNDNIPKTFIWANGVCFDIPKLEHAFESCGIETPWVYHEVNDLRTFRNFVYPKRSEEKYNSSVANGEGLNSHDAVDDCIYQIAILQELYSRIHVFDFDESHMG